MAKILLNGKSLNLLYNKKCIKINIDNEFNMARNLFDKNNMFGTYSNKIPVISGQNYKIYRADTGGFNTHFKQLDKDGNVLFEYVANADGLTVSENVAYLQVNTFGNSDIINNALVVEGTHSYDNYTSFNENISFNKSKWNGKRWLVLGDSISTGNGSLASIQFASEPYHYLIAKEKGIIVTNLAASGYTTQQILKNTVSKLIGDYYPDLITIFCGVNDINFACDTDIWYDNLLAKLKEMYPFSTIGIICPLDYRGSDNRLVEKINIIKSKGDKYNVKYLDMYKSTGWDFQNDNDVNMYTCNSDGLHPNNLGHSLIKMQIDNFIESL